MSKNLQTLNGQNKLALWAGRISECRSSGRNVKSWYKENGICLQTYYKWQRRLFEVTQAARSGNVAVTVRRWKRGRYSQRCRCCHH